MSEEAKDLEKEEGAAEAAEAAEAGEGIAAAPEAEAEEAKAEDTEAGEAAGEEAAEEEDGEDEDENGNKYAYVRNGDRADAQVIRITEDKLHLYLLDPLRIPTFDKDGHRVGESWVPAAWPFTLKINDTSPEAVRGYRASAEQEGFVFQFTEASKADWKKTQ